MGTLKLLVNVEKLENVENKGFLDLLATDSSLAKKKRLRIALL